MRKLKMLEKAIISRRFAWEKYLSGGYWHGMFIHTQPLFCSYGLIGFTIFSPYGESFEGQYDYDFELNELNFRE